MPAKARVLLVDEQPVVRIGITDVINAQKGLEVCAQAGGLAEACRLAEKLKPDLVITDISLDGNSGLELMKELAYRWPDLPVLVYSIHEERVYAERALRAGARGYLMKQESPQRLIEAIMQVLQGRIYLSGEMADRLLGKLVAGGPTASPIDRLSDRELEVLQLMGKGLSTSKIAESLCLSTKTVETHREHLKHKLGLHGGTELVRYAVEWSLAQGGA